jgi:hypothetical protein
MIDLTKSYVVRNSAKIITENGVCCIKLSAQAHKRRNSIKVPKFSKKCGVSQKIWCLCLSFEIIKRNFFEKSRKIAQYPNSPVVANCIIVEILKSLFE